MRTILWTAVLWGLIASGIVPAQDRDADHPSAARNRAPRESMRGQWSRGESARPRELQVDSGYVFINDQYVASPYKLELTEGGVTINGHSIAIESVPSDPRFRHAPVSRNQTLRQINELLTSQGAVIVKEDSPVVFFDQIKTLQMLRIMCIRESRPVHLEEFVRLLPEEADTTAWRAWLSSFEPSSVLHERAGPPVQMLIEREGIGQSAIAANQRLQAWAYPLTVFGMLAGVISFGHLLQFPPQGSYDVAPSRRRRDLCRATVIFLVMVIVLSMLDLVWTLLASQAGQMNELNPIGRRLMDNPLQLTTFKMVATLFSCGLLMWLRKHPRAQLASWWLCLICTLLTFRWLVLNSMFVA